MNENPKQRGADLTPEQVARIEAIRQANSSPEARARQAQIRDDFKDRPGRDELIRRGHIDPSRTTTMGTLVALHKVLARLRRVREERKVSLTDLAARSGIALASLSRMESGKNASFTFETLARYAAGLGLSLDVSIQDPAEESKRADAVSVPPAVGTLLFQTLRQLGELLDALGSSPASHPEERV